MRPSSANHALLQLVFLLSFFIASYGEGRDFDASVINGSDRKFSIVVKDENGHVKKREDTFDPEQEFEWKIEKTTKTTNHTCQLTYGEFNDRKTVNFVAFKEQEEEGKWLEHKTDKEGYVTWSLDNVGVHYYPAGRIEEILYKTWVALEMEARTQSDNHRQSFRV